MPKIQNLSDASHEDVENRLKELKSDFSDINDGRRSLADLDADGGLEAMINEVNTLDGWYSANGGIEKIEQARLAATAGAATGNRSLKSIGEMVVTENLLSTVSRDPSGPGERVNTPGFGEGNRSFVTSFEFDGLDGQSLNSWMRLASMYGADGLRAVTEWGSGGPGVSGPMGTNYDTTAANALAPRGQPIAPVPRQAKLYLRDLIPHMNTTLADVPYVKELNPVTYESAASGGATTVAEAGTKPTANLSFVAAHAPITVIAATLTISKQLFADAQAVVQYINQRLPYLVKFREDAQILNGSGTWPDMQGLNNAGIGATSSAGSGTGNYAITIGNAIAQLENQDGSATAVVMNPTNAWGMFTNRASTSGVFDAGNPFSEGIAGTVWGVPVYRTRAYAAGSALVADFQRGAMLADREQVNVQVYNERYAEQNLVLLICEERLGLLVFRPDLFTVAAFS